MCLIGRNLPIWFHSKLAEKLSYTCLSIYIAIGVCESVYKARLNVYLYYMVFNDSRHYGCT